MITRSNVRVGEINVTPKMVFMINLVSGGIDFKTEPLYSSDADQPKSKATLREILEE